MKLLAVAVALLSLSACDKKASPPTTQPAGEPQKSDTTVLSAGAEVLQSFDPVKQIDTYLDGFHVMKDRPDLVMEAHHYCRAKNEEVTQCVIYDANTKDANLIGIEYIISERLFEGLFPEEKKLWHPHNYEILSGQLVGPGLPEVAEKAFLKKKMNSYGKTWHVWDTGHHGHPVSNELPLGSPLLAWSFNADGELPPDLLATRDSRLKVDTAKLRKGRAELAPLAHAQQGVNDLAAKFPNRSVPDFVKAK